MALSGFFHGGIFLRNDGDGDCAGNDYMGTDLPAVLFCRRGQFCDSEERVKNHRPG